MISFLWRRLTQTILIILGVTLLTFSLFHFVGGDPALQYAGKNASAEAVASLRQELGLDRSLPLQYVYFLKQLLTWDWGRSWATKKPVTTLITDHIGASLSLTLPAYFFSVLLALLLALFMAYLKNSLWDQALLFCCFILMSFSFLVYIIYAQKILAFDFNFFPVYGWNPSWVSRWVYVTLPCVVYVLASIAPKILLFRATFLNEVRQDYVLASIAPKILLFRATFLNEVRQDYVRTAYAKGLSPLQIYGFHILKNAALPILALVTSQMPTLITGSLLLEAYFGIPGLGGLLLKAIQSSDLPVVKAITVMGSLIYVFFNLLNDILAAFFDARVELR